MRSPHESYTVKQVITMGLLSIKNFPNTLTNDDLAKVKNIAKLLGIDELLNEPVGKLSGGQQQRVFLARTLIREPLMLFLDEPFSSLDPSGREEVTALINDYIREKNATALIVSHIVDKSLEKVADAVLTISNGELISVLGNPN
jgi:ABC-type Mn2+/Zn2+ transport system ATPase subunit